MMKKIVFNILLGISLIGFYTSCLQGGTEISVPTYEQEQLILKAYIDTLIQNGRDVDTTDLGVFYIVLEEGEGERAKIGDTITVGYSGYFVDGALFESSQWYNPNDGTYEFILGSPSMIPGWEDAIKLMNNNAKMQFIVPSALAYGSEGAGSIPPYTTLIFVIKMVDIKPLM